MTAVVWWHYVIAWGAGIVFVTVGGLLVRFAKPYDIGGWAMGWMALCLGAILLFVAATAGVE